MAKYSQLLTLFGFFAVSYFFVYVVLYLRSFREEMHQVQALTKDIAEVKKGIEKQTKRALRSESRENKIFMLLDPWERCMRIKYQTKCELGKTPPGEIPCALDILKEFAFALTDALESAKVTYWISYGTLLGAVRNESLIPWTADVDFVVPGEEFKDLGRNLRRTQVLEKNGYMFFYDKKYPDLGRMCIVETATKYLPFEKLDVENSDYFNAYPYVDIYQTQPNMKDQVIVKFGPPCKFPRDIVFPLSRVTMYGKSMSAPHNTTAYLSQIYGSNFIRPPPKAKMVGHGAYSDACQKG